MDLASWFQILGVVISIFAFLYAREARQKLLELRSELNDIERQRERDRVSERDSAYMVPSLTRLESSKYQLEIENKGEASARNVELFADGKPIGDFFRYQDFSSVEDNVFEKVSPKNKLIFRTSTTKTTPLPSKVHGSFEDGTGDHSFSVQISSHRA